MGFSVRVDDDHAGRVDNVGVLNFHAAASPDGVRMQPSNTVPVMVDGTEGVDLTLVKTHDGNFHAGLEQAYTLKVHAANQPSAGAISVVDTLPDGMQLVSATGRSGPATRPARPSAARPRRPSARIRPARR